MIWISDILKINTLTIAFRTEKLRMCLHAWCQQPNHVLFRKFPESSSFLLIEASKKLSTLSIVSSTWWFIFAPKYCRKIIWWVQICFGKLYSLMRSLKSGSEKSDMYTDRGKEWSKPKWQHVSWRSNWWELTWQRINTHTPSTVLCLEPYRAYKCFYQRLLCGIILSLPTTRKLAKSIHQGVTPPPPTTLDVWS